ncbi:MAG: winged helix-turn-helix transcriptional regulator, partial [Bdellovibrionales bacterium]|nr:winged helix-turn-helix transcriptional regulator [Bdellovibrionales bacterium]
MDFPLFRTLLEFQILIRRFQKQSILSVTESHTLSAIERLETCYSKDLGEALGLDKSTISRSIQKLDQKNYLIITQDQLDARAKVIALSATGLAALKKDKQQRQQASNTFLALLDEDAQEELVKTFTQMMDQLDPRPYQESKQLQPLRNAQRRMARYFGLLSDNYFESGLGGISLHILIVLDRKM